MCAWALQIFGSPMVRTERLVPRPLAPSSPRVGLLDLVGLEVCCFFSPSRAPVLLVADLQRLARENPNGQRGPGVLAPSPRCSVNSSRGGSLEDSA